MKKYKKNLSILVMAVILLSSNLVSNAAPMKTNEKLQGRSLGEQVQLKKQFENMFPEEYHYILEYEQNGVSEMDVNDVKVIFDEPVRAITPGQAVVFYDGDIVYKYIRIVE